MGKFNYVISGHTPISNFTTEGLFDESYEDSKKSAIDDFIEKRQALFKLIKPYESNISSIPKDLTNMIVLGCVSAVESFIRKLIRTIIINDESSKKKCENVTLKYGAVVSNQNFSMLPEALLEEFSFTNGKNIKDTINALLGIQCNSDLFKTVFGEYSDICELRHCIVHRFGMLGSNNAIRFGLSKYDKYIEKPIIIDFDHLNDIVQVCENLVKVLNSHLFSEVLERTYKDRSENWSFDYRKDKKIFLKYYNIFKDSSSNVDEKEIYYDFKKVMIKEYGEGYIGRGRAR